MHGFPLLFFALLTTTWVTAQPPAVQWQRNLGGSANDLGSSIHQTSDGGYIVCGTTFSNNGDVSGNQGNSDAWVVKLDAQGNVQWQRCLGGAQPDNGRAIFEYQGGYVMLGDTRSTNGDVSGNHGSSDIWLVRLDGGGSITWQRCYGGSLSENAAAVEPTNDGGLIVAGSSRSTDGDLATNAGGTDFWIFKVDVNGDLTWQYAYGGSLSDEASDLVSAPDGGCVVTGVTSSDDGHVSGNHGGLYDAWVIKLDSAGVLEWQRACGGGGTDLGTAVVERSDGNYRVMGTTDSNDGDINQSSGSNDLWTFVLNTSGQLITSDSFGGSSNDAGSSLVSSPDAGAIVFGSSASNDGDLSVNQGMFDGWIFRTDMVGTILWSRSLGGSLSDGFATGNSTDDGGYVAVGQSTSNDGDVPANNGGGDVWVVKFGPDAVGIPEASAALGLELHPNPCFHRLRVSSTCQPSGPRRWKIIDAQGRVAKEGTLSGGATDIDVASLRSGAYTLVMRCDAVVAFSSFVKE